MSTSMLPRVALEYGQRSCAAATSSSASAWGSPGTSAFSRTASPNLPPGPLRPMSTSAVTVAPSTTDSRSSRRAMLRIALAKHAA